ncbi:MAG: hypothetical protein FWB88_09910 [Defluviitaleaceae bacterium]|nr:hypothetical protein [Defluviitaleaceae bacterium]MCL2239847.1 hypothetical protein [Defluviitaleaceae bacterium]
MLRLTSSMINNTTLLHVNRNMRNLDTIIRTLETTKRVSRPSDNPLVASRALKFRAGVREAQQFQRNVEFGQAWMDVTESSFLSILDNQMQDIRRLLVAGASGTYNIENKATMIGQMRELIDHIGTLEMNQTYAGRYVFAGFRTDEPPVFTSPNERRFIITQHFNLTDVDRTASFQRLEPNAGVTPPVAHKVHVVRLAFRNLDMHDTDGNRTTDSNYIDNTQIYVPGFTVLMRSINDEDAYYPIADFCVEGRPILHLIVETGELAMSDNTAATFPREGIAVTYERTGFERGEINPAVYFTSREMIDEPPLIAEADRVYQITQYFSRVEGTPTTIGATLFYSFDLVFDAIYTDNNDPANLRPVLPPGASIDAGPPSAVLIPAEVFDRNRNVSVSYSVEIEFTDEATTLAEIDALKTDLRVQGVKLIRATLPGVEPLTPIPIDQAERNRSFDMHDQNMTIEAAAHNHVGVNSLGKNIFTANMFADFRRFFEFTDSLVISDEGELRRFFSENPPYYTEPVLSTNVDRQLINERAIANDALFTHFNNMLFLVDRHIDQITREHTQLGARKQRMDLLQARLESDEVTLERLTSQNEDTDMYRAIMLRVNAEAAFQASLRANSGIIQMTLANFIN